jgi:phage terminase large subunit-like protein
MEKSREVELRIAGTLDAARAESLSAAVRAVDPDASVSLDPATGIVRLTTTRDTLEIVSALNRRATTRPR